MLSVYVLTISPAALLMHSSPVTSQLAFRLNVAPNTEQSQETTKS